MRAVTAGIILRGGRALICKRPEDKKLAGKWEFPGGKLEIGESLEQCLLRELKEELAIECRIISIYDAHADANYIVIYYIAEIISGEPTAIEHSEIRWADISELGGYDFPEGDALVAARMMRAERQ